MTDMLILRGLPASGKSTRARQWVAESPATRARSNRDDLRFLMFGAYVLSPMQEDAVTVAQHAQVESLLSANISVVIDDTNLRAATVKNFLKIADKQDTDVSFEDVDTDLEECVRRNALRGERGDRMVPEDIIRSFAQRYLRKGKFPEIPALDVRETNKWIPYQKPQDAPDAIMVDLDGTLAQFEGRGPFDWSRVGEDSLKEDVANVVRDVHAAGKVVVFMSGRSSVCRSETTKWLQKHGFVVDHLYMRKENDQRPDDIVKHELFNTHVRDRFNIVGVFDDRKSVCKLWHSMGLTLFRVGDPEADF